MHPGSAPPPTILGIELGEVLGSGGCGRVYAGRQIATGLDVAVKVVDRPFGEPAQVAERAVQEARLCLTIDHPNVVRAFEWGRLSTGGVYLVMERLLGATLEQHVRTKGPLTVSEAIRVARCVSSGLVAVHGRGAVHRDIKPANIFLSDGQTSADVRLLDLGIASLAADDPARNVRTVPRTTTGSPGFIAPEQARGEPVDARADIYSLGVTLFYALTGSIPFTAQEPLALLVEVARAKTPPEMPERLPLPLRRLLAQMMHPDVARRPANATALWKILSHLMAPPEVTTGHTTLCLDGRTIAVAGMHSPTPGHRDDAERLRAELTGVVLLAFPPGRVPPEVAIAVADVEAIEASLPTLIERRDERRRAADEAAGALHLRARRLGEALEELAVDLETAEVEWLSLTTSLMSSGAVLTDLQARTRRIQLALRDIESGPGSARGDGVEAATGLLREFRTLRRERAAGIERERAVREHLELAALRVADLRLQRAELERARLQIEVERFGEQTLRESRARSTDDEVVRAEQDLEHALVELAAALADHFSRTPA